MCALLLDLKKEEKKMNEGHYLRDYLKGHIPAYRKYIKYLLATHLAMTSTIERNKDQKQYQILKQILHQRFFNDAKDDIKNVEGVNDFIDTENRKKGWLPPYRSLQDKSSLNDYINARRHPDPWDDIPTAQAAYINMTLKVLAHPSFKDYKTPKSIPKDFENSMEAYLVLQCRFGVSDSATQFHKWEKKWNNLKIKKILIPFDKMMRDHRAHRVQIQSLTEVEQKRLKTIEDNTKYYDDDSPMAESAGGPH